MSRIEVRKSLFLVFIVFLMSIQSNSVSSPFIFISNQPNNNNYLHFLSSSFEKFRQDLTNTMQLLSPPTQTSTYKKRYIKQLKDIFDNYHEEYFQKVPIYWEKNEYFLKFLLKPNKKKPFVSCLTSQPMNYTPLHFQPQKHVSSYNNFHQLLVHLERDWGNGGRNVRQRIYLNGILLLLQKYLPLQSSSSSSSSPSWSSLGENVIPRVLVPGAGLGRLAVELAVLGYRVEANECSEVMIRVLHSILTKILSSDDSDEQQEKEEGFELERNEDGDLLFYPFLHFPLMDEWNHLNRLKPSFIPSSDTQHIKQWLQTSSSRFPSLTVQSGDFLSIYSPDSNLVQIESFQNENSFSCVVTSFFIDTSTDILDYLLTIRSLLRPGGIWINSGPLHYHSVTFTPYSYSHLETIIQRLGFVKLESHIVESSYCGEEKLFMKPEYYHFPIDVWRLETKSLNENESENESEEDVDEEEEIEENRFVLKTGK